MSEHMPLVLKRVFIMIGIAGLGISLGAASPSALTIVLKDKKFSAKTVQVKPGDTLQFKNGDSKGTTHSLYSLTKGYEFDLKAQKPGKVKKLKITKEKHKPGKFQVSCAVHADRPGEQNLTVEVK